MKIETAHVWWLLSHTTGNSTFVELSNNGRVTYTRLSRKCKNGKHILSLDLSDRVNWKGENLGKTTIRSNSLKTVKEVFCRQKDQWQIPKSFIKQSKQATRQSPKSSP